MASFRGKILGCQFFEIHPIVRANISREARLMTDESRIYVRLGKEFSAHGTTVHARHEAGA